MVIALDLYRFQLEVPPLSNILSASLGRYVLFLTQMLVTRKKLTGSKDSFEGGSYIFRGDYMGLT